jgi:hypothetical protein
MSSIAYENGFFWQTLWNHPSNTALKAQRKNPNVLMTGDVVHIPDLTVRNEPGATEATHTFVLKGVPEKLRMKLLDASHKPRANLSYTIEIDGKPSQGQTDANGELAESISPNAKKGRIIIQPPPKPGQKAPPPPEVIQLNLGNLDPITEPTGIRGRLSNLKFYSPPADGDVDKATKAALCAFQKKNGLAATGQADDATQAKLLQVHGH